MNRINLLIPAPTILVKETCRKALSSLAFILLYWWEDWWARVYIIYTIYYWKVCHSFNNRVEEGALPTSEVLVGFQRANCSEILTRAASGHGEVMG